MRDLGVYVVEADQCMFGLKTWGDSRSQLMLAKKPTRFMTNSQVLGRELSRKCDNNHEHQPLLDGRGRMQLATRQGYAGPYVGVYPRRRCCGRAASRPCSPSERAFTLPVSTRRRITKEKRSRLKPSSARSRAKLRRSDATQRPISTAQGRGRVLVAMVHRYLDQVLQRAFRSAS